MSQESEKNHKNINFYYKNLQHSAKKLPNCKFLLQKVTT